jgi:hypothetical protein
MFKSLHKRARSVAAVGVIAALAVAGVAVAQGGNGGGEKGSDQPRAHRGKRMPPPPGGPMARNLTYAEFHVQRNGQAEVQRLDRGKIVSVDDTSITLAENDGNEVTISIDENTKVLAGPGSKTEVSDLKTGQKVLVAGPEGGTAKAIMVPPKRGQKPRGALGGQRRGHMPPPPGAPFGGPQGGSQGAPQGAPGR